MSEKNDINPHVLKEHKRRELVETKEYIITKNRKLMTSRFNNSTWNENKSFISNKKNLIANGMIR